MKKQMMILLSLFLFFGCKPEGPKVVITTKEDNIKALFDGNGSTVWEAPKEGSTTILHDFGKQISFNAIEFSRVVYQQEVTMEDKNKIKIDVFQNNEWKEIFSSEEIPANRNVATGNVSTSKIRIFFNCPKVSALGDLSFKNIEKKQLQRPFRVSSYWRCFTTTDWSKLSGQLNGLTDLIMIDVCKGWDENGNIIPTEPQEWNGNKVFPRDLEAEINAFKEASKGKNIRLWFCIPSNKHNNLDKKTVRQTLINDCVGLIEKHDFYGIDIDYEYPSGTQWDDFSSFIIELNSTLKTKGKKVSAAVNWGVGFNQNAKNALEMVNIMAYDAFDKLRKHSTFPTAQGYVSGFMGMGFKASQLMLGLAFYGREMNPKAEERWFGYNNFISNYGSAIERGTNLYDGSYFTGFYLNREKTFMAIQQGIGGVFSWHLKCDVPFDDERCLSKAIEESIRTYCN